MDAIAVLWRFLMKIWISLLLLQAIVDWWYFTALYARGNIDNSLSISFISSLSVKTEVKWEETWGRIYKPEQVSSIVMQCLPHITIELSPSSTDNKMSWGFQVHNRVWIQKSQDRNIERMRKVCNLGAIKILLQDAHTDDSIGYFSQYLLLAKKKCDLTWLELKKPI